MIRIAFVIALLAGLLAAASPAFTQEATPEAAGPGPGTPTAIYDNSLEPIGEITVLNLMDPLGDYDRSSPPQRGFRYVGLVVSFTNRASRPIHLDISQFSVIDRAGFSTSASGITRTRAGEETIPSLPIGEVAPGATVTGLVTVALINGSQVQEVIYAPAGDRRIRIVEYGPDAVDISPQATAAASPQATADAACAAVATWDEAVDAELGDITPVFELVDRASGGEAVAPPDLRDGAAAGRAAAQAIAGLDTPPDAQAASDQIVGLLNDMAGRVDELADRVEAGDSPGIVAAVAAIYGLALETTGGAYGDLAARCPALDD